MGRGTIPSHNTNRGTPISRWKTLAVTVFALVLQAAWGEVSELRAQDSEEALKVFLDCPRGGCDLEYIRGEVEYVNWVRDRADADVHILATPEGTGAGGRMYSVEFLGLGSFDGSRHFLEYPTRPDQTRDEQRQGMLRILTLGLAPFAASSLGGDALSIDVAAPAAGAETAAATPEDDPWNFWVFRLGANGFFNGQSSRKSQDISTNLSANRTTDELKVRLGFNSSYSENEFELSTGPLTTIQRDLQFRGLVAWSIGEQWAFGLKSELGSSTFQNQDFRVMGAPLLEYNFFPYSESTRKELTLTYEVGPHRFRYREPTIFDQTAETKFQQAVRLGLDIKQTWGSASISAQWLNYMDDFDANRATLFANTNYRITRGLSLDFFGSYARIRDQLNLPRGGATDDEVLLRLRQLETSYSYFFRVGLRYTFGSIFNNVVNSRLEGGSGGIFFF